MYKKQIDQDAVKGAEAQRVLGMHLTDERIEGFCKVSVCENVTEAAVTVMHHAGIGSLQPNTVSGMGCVVLCCWVQGVYVFCVCCCVSLSLLLSTVNSRGTFTPRAVHLLS